MAKKIVKVLIDRVDLCENPANQESHVLLFKSADMDETRKKLHASIEKYEKEAVQKEFLAKFQEMLNNKEDAFSVDDFQNAIDELEKFGGKYMAENTDKIKELEGSLTKANDAITAKDGEIVNLKAELQKAQDSVAELKKSAEPVDIWKGIDPKVKEEFESMQKALATATETQELTEITKRVASDMKHIPGKLDENAAFLRNVTKKLEKADADKLFALLKSADALIEKGKIFDSVGDNGTDNTGSPVTKFMNEVKAVMAKGEAKTEAQAIGMVAKAFPNLYNEHVQSVRNGGK